MNAKCRIRASALKNIQEKDLKIDLPDSLQEGNFKRE